MKDKIIKKIDEDLVKLRYLKNDLKDIRKSLLEERLKTTSEEEKK